METVTMGKVLVKATIENLEDLWEVAKGTRQADEVRRIEIADALVDTGATKLSLPLKLIETLGLKPYGTRTARTCAGTQSFKVHGMVELTVQGRKCRVDVVEVPDTCPPLIGQIPLEDLDFVVDPNGQRLIGNPEHGGEHMIELF